LTKKTLSRGQITDFLSREEQYPGKKTIFQRCLERLGTTYSVPKGTLNGAGTFLNTNILSLPRRK
jgi:hypothetical protein